MEESMNGNQEEKMELSGDENVKTEDEEKTEDTGPKKLKIGSRKSKLAVLQSEIVKAEILKHHPDVECEIVTMDTIGDKIQDVALSKIGTKNLFTKELEQALSDKEVDLVVHSLKDLPTTLPETMVIAAVLKREDPRDVVILRNSKEVMDRYSSNGGTALSTLPDGAIVGTSSVRRIAQLKRSYPALVFESVRGNLQTRLTKLDAPDGKYSALILAAAGVHRLAEGNDPTDETNWMDRITQYLESKECMHAVSQGALAVEILQENRFALQTLRPLNDRDTVAGVGAERAFMKTLDGGCSAPVGVRTHVHKNTMVLQGGVWSLDGSKKIFMQQNGIISKEFMMKKKQQIAYNSPRMQKKRMFMAKKHSKEFQNTHYNNPYSQYGPYGPPRHRMPFPPNARGRMPALRRNHPYGQRGGGFGPRWSSPQGGGGGGGGGFNRPRPHYGQGFSRQYNQDSYDYNFAPYAPPPMDNYGPGPYKEKWFFGPNHSQGSEEVPSSSMEKETGAQLFGGNDNNDDEDDDKDAEDKEEESQEREQEPWWTDEIADLVDKRKVAQRQYHRTKTPRDKGKFSELRAACRSIIRKAKFQYYGSEGSHRKGPRVFNGMLVPAEMREDLKYATDLGEHLGNMMLKNGANEILAAAKKENQMEAPNVAPIQSLVPSGIAPAIEISDVQ